MRTLKKVLALTIVFAFAFTMMAGATVFTDDKNIKSQDQVNLVYALGIMKGYPDGSFGADKTITRAEAAKMMYVIKNGKDSGSDNYKTSANPFTDVPSTHWAKGYINYCYLNGIIAGVGYGKFNPDGQVTGAQLAKMLLAVIGYDAKKANLTGSQWLLSTMSLAFQNKLFDDYAANVDAAAPREDAAVIFYNTIFTSTVTFRDGEYVNYNSDNEDLPTVGKKNFNLVEYKGVLVGANNFEIGKGGSADDKIYLDRDGDLNAAWKTTGDDCDLTLDYKDGDAKALVGQYVKVVYDSNKKKVYNIVPTDDNKVYSMTVGDIDSVTGAANKINFDDDDYTLAPDNTLKVFSNYDAATIGGKKAADAGFTTAVASYLSGTDSGDPVRFVDYNGDDTIDFVFVTNRKFGYVDSLDSKSIMMAGTSVKLKDDDGDQQVFGIDNVKEGDYVYYYKDAVNDNYYVTKATSVTGAIEGAKATKSTVKVNGTFYKLSQTAVGDLDDADQENPTVGDNYTLYLDGAYWIAALTGEGSIAGSGNYAYVDYAIDKKEGQKPTVGVWLPGEDDVNEYTLDGDSTFGTDNKDVTLTSIKADLTGKLFAYKILSDGSIKLSQDFGKKFVTGANISYNDNSDLFTVSGPVSGTYMLADDAVIFYSTKAGLIPDNGWEVYGKGDFDTPFHTTDNHVTFYYTTSGGFSYIKAAVIDSATALDAQNGAASDDIYGYLLSDPIDGYDKAKDQDYVEYSVWANGAKSTVRENDGTITGDGGSFVKYTLKADGTIKKITELTMTAANTGDITAYNKDSKKITIKDCNGLASIYALTSDTQTIYINNDDSEGETATGYAKISSSAADTTGISDDDHNVFFVLDTDKDHEDEILFIAVDSSETLADPR